MKSEIITSTDEFESIALQWNDLWDRSKATSATLRAEHLLMWMKQFAPDLTFRVILIREGDRLLAALPLIGQKLRGVVEVGVGTFNSWSPNFDLLLDEVSNVESILDHMIAKLDDLPWPMIWLDGVAIESCRWQEFQNAAERRNLSIDSTFKHDTGVISTEGEWEDFRKAWGKSLRKDIGRQSRNVEKMSGYRLRIESPTRVDEIQANLERGFIIEDRSWKGANGSSILKSPGMANYYYRQACEFARGGYLSIAMIECEDGPVSYQYAWKSKGVFHSYKVGYDPAYRKHSPGQVLLFHILEKCFADPDMVGLDCMGPMVPCLRAWRPNEHRIGRLVVAPKNIVGSAMMFGYTKVRSALRLLKRNNNGA